jgi:EAL and modified HD-GYP domain-containing signal transduction protein
VELIAAEAHLTASEPFLVGLLSVFESILDLPLETIARQVAVSDEIRAALLGAPSPLYSCLELARAYEKSDRTACEEIRKRCPVSGPPLVRAYQEAMRWAANLSKE